jgi:hypothetical protein
MNHPSRARVAFPNDFPGRVRKATVVLFGIFQVEDISLPIRIEDMEYLLLADPCEEVQRARESGGRGNFPTFWDIESSLPSPGDFGPPIAIRQFFHFILSNKFNYRFGENAFQEEDDPGSEIDGPLYSLTWPHLFSHGEWGYNLVEPIDD